VIFERAKDRSTQQDNSLDCAVTTSTPEDGGLPEKVAPQLLRAPRLQLPLVSFKTSYDCC